MNFTIVFTLLLQMKILEGRVRLIPRTLLTII